MDKRITIKALSNHRFVDKVFVVINVHTFGYIFSECTLIFYYLDFVSFQFSGSYQSFNSENNAIPALEMNLVDVLALLDDQLQLQYYDKDTDGLKTIRGNEKLINMELLNVMVQLNKISKCDAKTVALYKCQNSPLFIE